VRQASRRSWRIGQRHAVRVKFVTYAGTMQGDLLRLMGKKMLVALMMEGKFSGEGLQSLDTDEDLMSAMRASWSRRPESGQARSMWRELERERERVLPQPSSLKVEEMTIQYSTCPATELIGPPTERAGIHLLNLQRVQRCARSPPHGPRHSASRATQSLRLSWHAASPLSFSFPNS